MPEKIATFIGLPEEGAWNRCKSSTKSPQAAADQFSKNSVVTVYEAFIPEGKELRDISMGSLVLRGIFTSGFPERAR